MQIANTTTSSSNKIGITFSTDLASPMKITIHTTTTIKVWGAMLMYVVVYIFFNILK